MKPYLTSTIELMAWLSRVFVIVFSLCAFREIILIIEYYTYQSGVSSSIWVTELVRDLQS